MSTSIHGLSRSRIMAVGGALIAASLLYMAPAKAHDENDNEDAFGDNDATCDCHTPWENTSGLKSIKQLSVPLTAQAPGFGSGLAYDHTDDTFWGVTDRGPNTTAWLLNLVKFKVKANSVQVLSVTPITENGVQLTGVDLDPEDLVLSVDGTFFWVSDESRPRMVRIARTGEVLERVEPPAHYLGRVTNQGFEGISLSCDGNTVYALLQSGLTAEPDKRNTFILAYDVLSQTFREYKYLLDNPALETYPTGVTAKAGGNALVRIGPSTFLVAERDNADANSRIKRIYKIVIPEQPPAAPLNKTLFIDMLALGYPFFQMEGLAVKTHGRKLFISNDNNGDINSPAQIWVLKF